MENLEIMFQDYYKGKRVLVTGHTGFKGSWLVFWLERLGAKVYGISLDDLTKESHFTLINKNCRSFFLDIRNRKAVDDAVKKIKPEVVFHLAAQSLVIDGYKNPAETYAVNVIGTLNVLEACRRSRSTKVFVCVTTDKVYENKESLKAYKENDELGGFDMYSSSKAGVEIMVRSYYRSFLSDRKTFDLAVVRAGNVIGGGDHAAYRLIPDLVRAFRNNESFELRNPESVRPWQHVLEPLSAYLWIGCSIQDQKKGFDVWNIGPAKPDAVKVKKVIERFCRHLPGHTFKIKKQNSAAFHEAGLLLLDCNKIKKELGWKPSWDLHMAIDRTASWYSDFFLNGKINSADDLQKYVHDAKLSNQPWVN